MKMDKMNDDVQSTMIYQRIVLKKCKGRQSFTRNNTKLMTDEIHSVVKGNYSIIVRVQYFSPHFINLSAH